MEQGVVAFSVGSERDEREWKRALRTRLRRIEDLPGVLPGLSVGPWAERYRKALQQSGALSRRFAFTVTRYYLGLARPDDPRCPILRQILPDAEELRDRVFLSDDPLAEEAHMPVAGLTHRYADRTLWYLTHDCAAHCRFCLRRRKVSRPGSGPTREERLGALAYIRTHTEIREVILSGGDPLSLDNRVLGDILTGLRAIPHLQTVRIHTRMPVALPSRITRGLAELFAMHEPITVVTHFNHEREITPQSREALRLLRRAGCLLLNQSVLLRGVNDATADLEALFLGLLREGVKPYYLHQCDEVSGVAHFRVHLDEGMRLMRTLRATISGPALPTYVIDLPGGAGKVPVDSSYLVERNEDRFIYENGLGRRVELSGFDDGVATDPPCTESA